jgi:hypothetical protein
MGQTNRRRPKGGAVGQRHHQSIGRIVFPSAQFVLEEPRGERALRRPRHARTAPGEDGLADPDHVSDQHNGEEKETKDVEDGCRDAIARRNRLWIIFVHGSLNYIDGPKADISGVCLTVVDQHFTRTCNFMAPFDFLKGDRIAKGRLGARYLSRGPHNNLFVYCIEDHYPGWVCSPSNNSTVENPLVYSTQ